MADAAPMAISVTGSPRRRYAQIALLIGRLALGVVFLYAAYAKLHYAGAWHLRDYHFLFAFGINSYDMLSFDGALLLARVLPWVEVALGLLLISGLALRWVGVVTTALLIVFMYALSRAALKGLAINCGCFGNQSTSPARELVLDSLLLLTAVGVTVGAFLSRRTSLRMGRLTAEPAPPA
jgi:uncharacterized membrane protein YphA (DoxX/SURF4 family)